MAKKLLITFVLLLLFVTVFVGCGETPFGNGTGNVEATGITLDRTSATIRVGESITLVATVSPSNATDKTVTWTSSSSFFVSLTQSGTVTGRIEGTTTITATTSNGKSASCVVTVVSEDGGNGGNNNGGGNNGGNNSGTNPDGAPQFLGMIVTSSAPSQTDPLDFGTATSASADQEDAILNYYSDGANSLGDTVPTDDGCDLCTTPGTMVYVQLWFNNPNSCTILSLRLNGVKYQVGGQLRSYFYPNGSNCVYVEVPIPSTSKISESYTVTEVQYVDDSNAVSGNGTELFLGDKDTTVKVGLPYASEPWGYVEEDTEQIDYHTYSIKVFNIDDDYVVRDAKGWFRAVLFKGGEIVAQSKMDRGVNTLAFNNLIEGARYTLVTFAMYDKHDGEGLSVTILATREFETTKVVNVTATSSVYEYENGFKGAEITLEGTFSAENAVNSLVVAKEDGTILYTATADEIATFNSTKTLSLRSTALLNNNDLNVNIKYGASNHDATVTVHTPALTVPVFVNAGGFWLDDLPIYTQSGLDDHDNYLSQYNYGTWSSRLFQEEYVDDGYGNMILTDKEMLDTFITTNMLVKELAVVQRAGGVSFGNMVVKGYAENDYTFTNPLVTLSGNSGIYLAGEANLKLFHGYYDGNCLEDVEYIEEKVFADVDRYYVVIENWDTDASLYKYYAEFTVNLNDGTGDHFVRTLIYTPEHDVIDPYNTADQIGAPLKGRYWIESDYHDTAVLHYTPVHYPSEYYLLPNGFVKDSNGDWVDLSPASYSFNPVAFIDASQYLYTSAWPEIAIDCDKGDPAFANFRFVVYNECTYFYKTGIVNVRNVRGTTAEYCLSKEPVFKFTEEEIVALNKEVQDAIKAWNETYLSQIKEGEDFDVTEIEIPSEFFAYRTKEISIDLSKFPEGSYTLAVDHGYSGLEWDEKCSFIKECFPGKFGGCSVMDINLSSVSAQLDTPNNVRIEDGVLRWDAMNGVNKFVVQISGVKDNIYCVTSKRINGTYTYYSLLTMLEDFGGEDVTVSIWATNIKQELMVEDPVNGNEYRYYVDERSSDKVSINGTYNIEDGTFTVSTE